MADTPTPGQVAYEAYWRAFAPQFGPAYMHPWGDVHAQNQAAWEAAAQAVRALTPTLYSALYCYRLGQQVRWSLEPEIVWRITYRASHDDRMDGLRLYYGIKCEGSRLIRMAEESELTPLEDTTDA